MTKVGALYNENEPYAVEWLQNLERSGHIAAGEIDSRSIREVSASDVRGRRQAHFFAGLGGWSHALRLAEWPDDAPVWTGSCPCQPFSQSGLKKGFADDRHLWPVWFALIEECRPPVVFGEQVAGPDGLKWLDLVLADLEGAGYAVGTCDLCAAGVGAPHIRQRLFFVAVADAQRRHRLDASIQPREPRKPSSQADRRGTSGNVADSEKRRRGQGREVTGGFAEGGPSRNTRTRSEHPGEPVELGYARSSRGRGLSGTILGAQTKGEGGGGAPRNLPDVALAPSATFWSNCEWVLGRDGKARPVEPGTFPLAHGVPARVGKLRAYGNAIVPQAAAVFIRAARSAMIGVHP